MGNNILVSIITVVYNGEQYLQQTINSVLNQTYKNIEYIIIDGGSTDGTIDIIKNNELKISKWISEPDHGLYDAMNKGIQMAKGELIGMINSDDWYELNAVEIMVDAYSLNSSKNIFHADRYNVDENSKREIRKFNPSVFKFKYYGMTYNHPSMFITKFEYNKHLYNPNLRSHSDYQFVLEAYLRDSSIFYYIEKPIVNYRLDGLSAKQGMLDSTKEGFKSRVNSKFGLFNTIVALVIGTAVSIYFKIFNFIKRNINGLQ